MLLVVSVSISLVAIQDGFLYLIFCLTQTQMTFQGNVFQQLISETISEVNLINNIMMISDGNRSILTGGIIQI